MAQKIRTVVDLLLVLLSTQAVLYQKRFHGGAFAHSESNGQGCEKLIRTLLHQ